MKNLKLENGQISIIHTDVIMAIYTSNDNHTYMTIISDLMLYTYMTEDNLCIQDDKLKIINKHLLIPMVEVVSGNVTNILMSQLEHLRQELTLIKRCMHETVKVHAIKLCPSIPLNSYELNIRNSDNNDVIIENDITIVYINNKLRFNPSMVHVLSDSIVFHVNCNLDFDWKYLPSKLVSIIVNNEHMMRSYITNMNDMLFIPDEIHVNNYVLVIEDLDMLVEMKSNIVIYNNDKLIKYEKIMSDSE